MATSKKHRRLLDACRFAGFRLLDRVRGIFGDPKALIVTLVRVDTTARYDGFATSRAETPAYTMNCRLVMMDMWKPFRNLTREKAPQAAILFDKCPVMRHLGEAPNRNLVIQRRTYGLRDDASPSGSRIEDQDR